MGNYGMTTRVSPERAIEKAIEYFGEGGLGLELDRQEPCCAMLTGGGGHVYVSASAGAEETDVHLETREWDYHVKRFMAELKRAR